MVSGRGISPGTNIGFSWICSDPSESNVVEIGVPGRGEVEGGIDAVSEIVVEEEILRRFC